MKAFRQGDVILVRTESIPKEAKALTHRILAKGEVTGHQHQITEGDATLYEHEGTLFLRVVSNTAVLTHEEHGPITLPKGTFRVTIQREYTPEGWNRVAD